MLEVISELFSARNEDQRFIAYSGDYDFFIEPLVEGDLPYQTSSLSFKCYRNSTKQNIIITECKWFRVSDGKYTEITEAHGNDVYHLTPYDIGCGIRAAIKSTGPHTFGLAFMDFGPILLDPALKPLLENRLLCGMGSFQFSLIHHGKKEINDITNFSNVIEINEETLGVRFCDEYKAFQDFKIDLFASRGLQIKTVQYDNRILRIYFRKGEEEFISQSVLYAPKES